MKRKKTTSLFTCSITSLLIALLYLNEIKDSNNDININSKQEYDVPDNVEKNKSYEKKTNKKEQIKKNVVLKNKISFKKKTKLSSSEKERTHKKIIKGSVDDYKIDRSLDLLFSDESSEHEKIKSIRAIGAIATDDTLDKIISIINNKNESFNIREEALYSIDWENRASQLSNIFVDNNTPDELDQFLRSAIVLEAMDIDLGDDEVFFEEELKEALKDELSSDEVRSSIFEYFALKSPKEVPDLLNSVSEDEHSEYLQSYLMELEKEFFNLSR